MSRNTALTLGGIALLFLAYSAGWKKQIGGLTAIVTVGLILANWPEIHTQFSQLFPAQKVTPSSPQATGMSSHAQVPQ